MSPRKMPLYASVYAQWGWKNPEKTGLPFAPQPPIDQPEQLARFFSGREADVEKARDKLLDGNNIMVRGQFGIGKSAFLLTVLQRLRLDATQVEVLPLYIHDFNGETSEDLYRRILLSLAKGLSKFDPRAREIYADLTGEKVSVTHSRQAKTGFNLQVIDAGGEIGKSATRTFQLGASKEHMDGLLDRARQRNLRVFIALDDLDKHKNQAALWQLLNDAKALLRNSLCKFILTGRPLVTFLMNAAEQQLELYDPQVFSLAPLDGATLKQAAHGQLNLIRSNPRDDALPFTDETIERIVPLSAGIPRIFNRICHYTIEIARRRRWETIRLDLFESECLPEISEQIRIPLESRRMLYFILERQGIWLVREEDVDGLLDTMPQEVDTLNDAIPYLNDLIRLELLVPVEERGETRLIVAPLVQRALQSGTS